MDTQKKNEKPIFNKNQIKQIFKISGKLKLSDLGHKNRINFMNDVVINSDWVINSPMDIMKFNDTFYPNYEDLYKRYKNSDKEEIPIFNKILDKVIFKNIKTNQEVIENIELWSTYETLFSRGNRLMMNKNILKKIYHLDDDLSDREYDRRVIFMRSVIIGCGWEAKTMFDVQDFHNKFKPKYEDLYQRYLLNDKKEWPVFENDKVTFQNMETYKDIIEDIHKWTY